MPSATTTDEGLARASADVQRVMLAAMPLDLIVQECNRRGHQVCLHQLCRLTKQKVVAWHDEPLTEEDIPFDAEDGVRERAVRFAQLLNQGRLPPGYPPRAEEEEIPFNALEDTRS